jgi:tRNA(fMet)-specific endonuclease VapC
MAPSVCPRGNASAGKSVPYADGQIAAIAAVASLTLVTANVRDFEAFEGVRVVDWTK